MLRQLITLSKGSEVSGGQRSIFRNSKRCTLKLVSRRTTCTKSLHFFTLSRSSLIGESRPQDAFMLMPLKRFGDNWNACASKGSYLGSGRMQTSGVGTQCESLQVRCSMVDPIMLELSRAHEDHLHELLVSAPVARDLLPYSEEFAHLKEEFWSRSFKKMTDSEFWTALVSVAKKGGIRGKSKRLSAPNLINEQNNLLLSVLPVPLGQRDRLPYSQAFSEAVKRFNRLANTDLNEREVWLAILRLAK